MLIFIYGSDTYRSQEKLKEIVDEYKKVHKSGLNLNYLEGEKLNFQQIKEEVLVYSMFKEKKLIVIKNSFVNEDFQKEFIKNFKRIKDLKDVIIFYEKNKILKSNSFFKFLKKQAKCQEFEFLSGLKLKNWVKKEFEKYNCKIKDKEIDKLIEFIGSDLWRFSNEIKKLSSFKSEISEQDINLLIESKIETDIFKTIDFLAQRNKKKAILLIKKHLEKGDHPLYLLTMINFQFRNLLLIKNLGSVDYKDSYSLAKKVGMHPYVFKKSLYQAQKFSFEELKKIYQEIFQVDFNIKTGKLDAETALSLFITEI